MAKLAQPGESGGNAHPLSHYLPVFRIGIRIRIRIHQIHMFLGLPDPDPLVRSMDPDLDLDPDPSIIKQKYYCFMTSF